MATTNPPCPLLLLLLVSLAVVSVVDSFAAPKSYNFNLKSIARPMTSSNNIELPSQERLDSLLSVAITASKQAGEIILGNAGGADVLKSKANSRDLLTLIDPLCEKVSFFFFLSGQRAMNEMTANLLSVILSYLFLIELVKDN